MCSRRHSRSHRIMRYRRSRFRGPMTEVIFRENLSWEGSRLGLISPDFFSALFASLRFNCSSENPRLCGKKMPLKNPSLPTRLRQIAYSLFRLQSSALHCNSRTCSQAARIFFECKLLIFFLLWSFSPRCSRLCSKDSLSKYPTRPTRLRLIACSSCRLRSSALRHSNRPHQTSMTAVTQIFILPRLTVSSVATMDTKPLNATTPPDWTPSSWQKKPAGQLPTYPNEQALHGALAQLSRLPPLVTSWEIENLKHQLSEVASGQRFLLQGGDCSEDFED